MKRTNKGYKRINLQGNPPTPEMSRSVAHSIKVFTCECGQFREQPKRASPNPAHIIYEGDEIHFNQ